MLDNLFESVISENLKLPEMLLSFGTALLLGLFISLVYFKTHKADGYSSGFTITLIMLPAIISVIIILIGNNIARAFSLAGAFSLIRFRSAPGDPKDIAYVFFALGVGLACGLGFIAYAAVFAVVLCLAMVILQYTNYAKPKSNHMSLKITIPESLNFQGAFDDILNKYTDRWNLRRIKTSEFGTLFEVSYLLDINRNVNQKEFIDELRCRNGNLNISLTLKELEEQG
jgi:hypothetical protein